MSNTLTTPQKVVDYVNCTNAALEKAAAARQVQITLEKKASELIPGAVDALISHGRIAPENREKLANALNDHTACLELLTKLAAHRVEAETKIGEGVPANGATTKTASQKTTYPGQRTDVMRPSDKILWEKLGLPVPIN